jgi:hypothetical protein
MRRGANVAGRMTSSPGAANPDAEKLWLKNQVDALQAELEIVQKRLAAMKNPDTEK